MPFPLAHVRSLGLALILCPAFGQNSPARQSPPALSSLRQLNRDSGYIFDGTVLAVQTSKASETGVATVQITFRVEQAIRGTRNRQTLTIREWAGLWNSGERYRSGERLLLFLYSPGKLGLTSSVGGPLGRFAVDASGNVRLEDGRFSPRALQSVRSEFHTKDRVNARSLALAIRHADAE